jgi:hypothetical protein
VDKVTLDFENNMVEWDTDGQKGTEHCPDLQERKAAILAAMGYEQYDFSTVVNVVNAFANGEMTIEELQEQIDAESEK